MFISNSICSPHVPLIKQYLCSVSVAPVFNFSYCQCYVSFCKWECWVLVSLHLDAHHFFFFSFICKIRWLLIHHFLHSPRKYHTWGAYCSLGLEACKFHACQRLLEADWLWYRKSYIERHDQHPTRCPGSYLAITVLSSPVCFDLLACVLKKLSIFQITAII